jgi:hypothetical protein
MLGQPPGTADPEVVNVLLAGRSSCGIVQSDFANSASWKHNAEPAKGCS